MDCDNLLRSAAKETTMALCEVRFRGQSIEKQTGMNVILPDGEGPFPVLYLLHGLSDDYTIWHRRTSIERYVEAQPLIVVMPDGHRSFYCNDPRPGGLAYEDHIVTDVVDVVERTFPVIADRGARAIAGLSMGGYGAIMLGLRHPDVFSVACSHSGAMRSSSVPRCRPSPTPSTPPTSTTASAWPSRPKTAASSPPSASTAAARMNCWNGTGNSMHTSTRWASIIATANTAAGTRGITGIGIFSTRSHSSERTSRRCRERAISDSPSATRERPSSNVD